MYSLDVNFLKDRPELGTKEKSSVGTRFTPKGLAPLFVGAGVGLLPVLFVGGLWYFANNSNAELDQKIAAVTTDISKIDAQLNESKKLTEETNKITGETQALASVFNGIKPWSAMLQDLRDRIPPGVQVGTIIQTQAAVTPTPVPTPAPAKPNPNAPNQAPGASTFTTKLEIAGIARSFNDVNDFLLTLQRSSFFQKDQTQIVSATLIDNPTQLELPKAKTTKSNAPQVTYELPKVVEYRIQTSLSNVPASDLLRELDRKGAVGLVTRIRNLQEQGVNP